MPYITKERRHAMTFWPDNAESPKNPGELNFMITRLIVEYIKGDDRAPVALNYQRINDVIGALEGAKLEFYRRVAVPYENAKMAENGDVYE
jgi:uncharacterized protein DUF6899